MRRRRDSAWAVSVLCALGALFGCNGPLGPQAKELLRSGYTSYDKGDDQATVSRMSEFLAAHGRSRRADEAYYLRGLALYRLKDREGARADLNEAASRTSHKALRVRAMAALGELAYEDGEMAFAENMYRQALAAMAPDDVQADRVHYRLGCILQRQGRWRKADAQFNRLIYRFGDSALAGRARARVHCSMWTVQAAAYSRKARAAAAAAKLRRSGLSSFSRAVSTGGELLFVVQVGRYATYEQAASALPDVRKHSKDAFVTVTR